MSIEAMKQALEELQYVLDSSVNEDLPLHANNFNRTIKLLKQAIEQAEKQKPMLIPNGFELVAVKGFDDLMYWLDRCDRKRHLENCPDLIEPYEAFDYIPIHIPTNATQRPQREWVGLTDDDMYELRRKGHHHLSERDFRAIEAKLREKNAYGWQSVENPTQYLDDLRGGDAT
mgnify:CR=1 FL=1